VVTFAIIARHFCVLRSEEARKNPIFGDPIKDWPIKDWRPLSFRNQY
jgi:hypothetical protein